MLKSGTPIEGRDIYLVPMAEEFVGIRTRWMNSEEIGRKLNLPAGISEESTRLWTAKLANDPTRLDLIIHTQTNRQPVGYVGFRDIDMGNRKAEVYVGIGERAGRSHGFPAVMLIIKYAFEVLGFNKVYGKMRSDHPLSMRILTMMGGAKEGVLRSDALVDGKFHDVTIVSVLRDEFEAQRHHFEPYLKPADQA